ncbi:site-specific integrase [Actinomadura napierensis]|uniref:Uncharacterized protein n=1 Tax=Actinomadura napierensis TaxID=267854 RepID=A0ABN3AC63_9ACTN
MPVKPNGPRRFWGRVRAAAGIESVHFHGMQHTCVSPLPHLDIAPKIVREIEVTMKIYAHTPLDGKRPTFASQGCARLFLNGPDARPGR